MEYLILIVSLAGIVYGADMLVAGAVSIARKFRVSDFVIGAVIVGVGTSLPELTVSFIGALQGNPDVAIGNVVGSNIFNIAGILGATALFFPVAVSRDNMRFEIPLCIFVSLLLVLLTFNFFDGSVPSLGRADGIVLLIVFSLFMWYSVYRDRKKNSGCRAEASPQEEGVALWKASCKVLAGLVILIASCDFFVDNAIVIAKSLGMSDAVISITLIACGTSLPELAASIAAAVNKNTQLALGNIIGSNIFNITLILGLSSQVCTLSSAGIGLTDYAMMAAVSALPLLFGFRGRIGRAGGLAMLVLFIGYSVYLIAG